MKTVPNNASVADFIESLDNPQRKSDSKTLLTLMQNITKELPKMWGDSIVGFGSYHYRYESGREGDWFVTGFSPRKQSMTIYIMGGLGKLEAELVKLGKHTTGKSCLYIKKLDQVETNVLQDLISSSIKSIEDAS
jgi:hypothetical protein